MDGEEMRLLFTIDRKDYRPGGAVFARPSARAVIVRDGRAAMVYSRRYAYYKFPGGGIEPGESREEALLREAREETGLLPRPESVRPYGYVRRIQKGDPEDIFLQENFYYLCEAEEAPARQELDAYEAEEGFTLVWVDPREAIRVNEAAMAGGGRRAVMMERENGVLRMLIDEGIFG